MDKAGELQQCPLCDPKGHKKVRQAANQKQMVSNKAKGQLDAGKVISLVEGGVVLDDAPGVEVDHVPVESEAGSKMEIPVVAKVGGRKGKK